MKKRIFLISLIIFIISLLITIFLFITMNNQKLDYDIVKCTVTDVTKKKNYGTGNKGNRYNYIITVLYNNKNYELLNVYDSAIYKYSEGATVNVYLSNGKLYANETGVRTSSNIATAYFILLYITMGMSIPCLITWIYYKKEKNKEIHNNENTK